MKLNNYQFQGEFMHAQHAEADRRPRRDGDVRSHPRGSELAMMRQAKSQGEGYVQPVVDGLVEDDVFVADLSIRPSTARRRRQSCHRDPPEDEARRRRRMAASAICSRSAIEDINIFSSTAVSTLADPRYHARRLQRALPHRPRHFRLPGDVVYACEWRGAIPPHMAEEVADDAEKIHVPRHFRLPAHSRGRLLRHRHR